MAQTVVGFFDNPSDAQEAVNKLNDCGISRDRIDVSTGRTGTAEATYGSQTIEAHQQSDDNAITRFFKSLFGSDDDDADRYSRIGQNSSAIVTVHAYSREEAERAADVLDDCGAINVNERSAQFGYASTDRNYDDTRSTTNVSDRTDDDTRFSTDFSGRTGVNDTTDYTDRTDVSDTDRTDYTGRTDEIRDRAGFGEEKETSIPRIKEDMEISKKTIETGGVRVRSRIVERPVEENIRLREENVRVERTSVDRPASEADLTNFQERQIELTERAEVPVVNKEARVVEEVKLTKEVNERNETIRDNVRETEIDVENLNSGETRNRDTDEGSNRERGGYVSEI